MLLVLKNACPPTAATSLVNRRKVFQQPAEWDRGER
jgi:hypothetical protein